jgi:chemotaxis protein MotB
MRRRPRREEPRENPDRWLISYADFITLLFAFFTTLYAISVVDVEKADRLVTSIRQSFNSEGGSSTADGSDPLGLPGEGSSPTERTRLELLGDRVRELSRRPGFEDGLRVRQTEEGLVISLADSAFFAAGGAAIPPEASPILQELARLLAALPNHVRIEGHTDDRPISSAQFPSNWDLSAARAVTVVRSLERSGIASYRLSASGFAAERPLVSNESEEGRKLNRRVDAVVLRSRLSQREN